jgi:hypothetical protein
VVVGADLAINEFLRHSGQRRLEEFRWLQRYGSGSFSMRRYG